MKNDDDINDLVLFLAATAMKPALNDEIWQCYGYRKKPKHGAIWDRLFPKKFALENRIAREVLTMGLIDVLNGIKKTNLTSDTKLLVTVGVIDQFLFTTKGLFKAEDFMRNLFSSYASYLKSDSSKLHEPIILKSKEILNKKDFARFMVGTIKLLAVEHADDFLVKSEYIKDVVEKSSMENTLKISMSNEEYQQYAPLLEEKILNS